MDFTLEELRRLRCYCKTPQCAGARAGDIKYIVPMTNPSLACRLCDQPFDRAKYDKAIIALGQQPGIPSISSYKGGGKGGKGGGKGGAATKGAAEGGKGGKGKTIPHRWEEGWGDARTKGGYNLGGQSDGKGGAKGLNQLPDFAAQHRRADSGLGGADSKPRLYKTDLCRFYMRGTCANPDCNFAHGQADLRKKPPAKVAAFKPADAEIVGGTVNVSPDDRIAAGQKLKETGVTQVGQKLYADLFCLLYTSPSPRDS